MQERTFLEREQCRTGVYLQGRSRAEWAERCRGSRRQCTLQSSPSWIIRKGTTKNQRDDLWIFQNSKKQKTYHLRILFSTCSMIKISSVFNVVINMRWFCTEASEGVLGFPIDVIEKLAWFQIDFANPNNQSDCVSQPFATWQITQFNWLTERFGC